MAHPSLISGMNVPFIRRAKAEAAGQAEATGDVG